REQHESGAARARRARLGARTRLAAYPSASMGKGDWRPTRRKLIQAGAASAAAGAVAATPAEAAKHKRSHRRTRARRTADVIVARQGNAMQYPTDTPYGTAPPDPRTAADVAAVVERLDLMAQDIDVNAPWNHPNAEEWDRQTLDTWVRANSSGSDDFMALV